MNERHDVVNLGLLPNWLQDTTPDPHDLPAILAEDIDPDTYWTLEGVRGHVDA